MDDDEFTEKKKSGRGKAGGPVKVAKKDKYDALIIVVDCGSNMKRLEPNGASSFACATEAVDWILSRKIFSQSKDRVNMVLFGTDSTNNPLGVQGVDVKDEGLVPVEFDHIKYLQNEVQLTERKGNTVDAILLAVDAMKNQTEGDAAVENKSILFISNAQGTAEGSERLEHVARAVKALGVHFVAMGIDADLSSSGPNSVEDISNFVETVDGQQMSFSEASSALQNFSQKKTAGRAIRKNWEVANGVFLPLAMYVRSMAAKNPLKSLLVSEEGREMKREQQYFVKTEGGAAEVTVQGGDNDDDENKPSKAQGVDNDAGESKPSMREIEKTDLAYGYLFGKSKVVLTSEDMTDFKDHNFNEREAGGCMKLIQFTKRRNISPSFFIGTSSLTVFPGYDKKHGARDEKLFRVTLSLIQGMLEQDVVAICRYAYNANFHIQLMALVPRKDEETGQLYMTAIRLPFMDDWRPFALPDITLRGAEPSSTQIDLIDDLIDTMDLSNTGLRFDQVMNPHFQRQCTMMKIKAMNKLGSADDFALEHSLQPSIFLKRYLEPQPEITQSPSFKKLAAALPEIFELKEVVRMKRTRKEVEAVNKDHLKGVDGDEMEEEETVKKEAELPEPEGRQKKFWMKVRQALQDDGNTINAWMNNVASDMSLFSGDSMDAVERFKILRAEMLAASRVVDFNAWMMSLHGNDEYSDFFQFMDSENEPSLITAAEDSNSWYTMVDAEMFWSGMLDEDKK